jgi:ATP-dependent Clp protease ATP-binding subunit ClpA
MTPPPSLQALIDSVIQDAATDDPIGQLAVAASTASDLEQTTDALLGHFVDRCRRHGRSWSEISNALGVTKQAVHKRFAAPIAQRLAAATGRPTFERFTSRARGVLTAASSAALVRGHREVDTGHLLLGLYSEPGGLAAIALQAMQVTDKQVEEALRAAWPKAESEPAGPQDAADARARIVAEAARALSASKQAESGQAPASGQPPVPPPWTANSSWAPDARNALLNAVVIALEFGHNYIGTEHLLLALYRDPDSLAARVLAELGADGNEAQVRLTEMLRGFPQGQ